MNMSIVQAVINFILKILALFKNSEDTVDTIIGYTEEINEEISE